MAEYKFEYLKVLEEEGITEIPKEVNAKIRYAKMVLAKYTNKPSDAMLQSLTQADDRVVDAIESYMENKSQEQSPSPESKAPEQKVATPAPDAVVEKPHETPPPTPVPPSKEEQVKANLDANGRIHQNTLKSILGKLNTWDGEETVGSLHLEKVAFSDYYKVA